MLELRIRMELQRKLKFRARGIVPDDEIIRAANFHARPHNLDAILAQIPPELHEPLKARMRERPGEYHRLRDPLPESFWQTLSQATRVVLYSILPYDVPEFRTELARFRGYPVLGSLSLTAEAMIAKVAAVLKEGIDEGTRGWRCWDPHHGVRIEANDSRIDLVICVTCECMQVYDAPDDSGFRWADISERPEPALDAFLTEGGVELAPRNRHR